ncbi:hypothetical protein JZ751_013614, partial [Albula glossodonta]
MAPPFSFKGGELNGGQEGRSLRPPPPPFPRFNSSVCCHSIHPSVGVPCLSEGQESEAMGCTSAKQVSAVPSDEEGRGKAYSNGDVFT